jgi:hypothetical protein
MDSHAEHTCMEARVMKCSFYYYYYYWQEHNTSLFLILTKIKLIVVLDGRLRIDLPKSLYCIKFMSQIEQYSWSNKDTFLSTSERR